MFPRKVHTKHSHLSEKTVGCFGRLIADQTRQARQWNKITATSDKTQEASHAVAEIVAKRLKHIQLLSQ
jgi:ribosomal protein L14E/L6E/L27E